MVMKLEIGIFKLFAKIVPSVLWVEKHQKHTVFSVQESYFHPGQIAAREWGPIHPSCTEAPNMRLTTSPSGITGSFPAFRAEEKELRQKCLQEMAGGGKPQYLMAHGSEEDIH